VTTHEETERAALRVLGGAHPTTVDIGECLQESRAALRARETGDMSAFCEKFEAMTPGDA